MSFVLTRDAAETLVQPLPAGMGKDVSRIIVKIAPDHDGVDSLFFRVVLKDVSRNAAPSKELGQRSQRIAAELRRRAAKVGYPVLLDPRERSRP